MNEDSNMRKLLLKLIQNECNADEIARIIAYIKTVKGTEGLPSFEEVLSLLDNLPETEDEKGDTLYANILKKTQAKTATSPKTKIWKYAAAASVLLLVTLTLFLNKDGNTTEFVEPIIVNNTIKTGTDKATLTLADGSEVVIEKGQHYEAENITSNGEEIIYDKVTSSEIAYNTLTIPRGGQHKIILSDSTQVWLNSESQLKYPVAFIEGQTRQVELVYGEAYFNVSPSTSHKGSKFKVFNKAQEVEVLGTEFNIKAYRDDVNIYTTLVEGKVAINIENQNRILVPNEQSNLDLQTNAISVMAVDVYNVVSWKEGEFIFKRKSLKEIMKVLSRWYDMDVVFENKELEDIRFMGTLGKSQDITVILNSIKSFGVIKNYEINNKTIILK